MFPAKVMLNNDEPDDASNMGTFDRLDCPLVSGMTVPKLSQGITSVAVLQAQRKAFKIFRKN